MHSALDRSNALPIPGIGWGDYPERPDPRGLRAPARAGGLAWRPAARRTRRVAAVQAQAAAWRTLGEADFDATRAAVQARLAHEGPSAAAVELAAACAVEAARRALGKQAYDGQVLAALCMMENRLVEMATGEGKSLATALAAAMGALAGMPVHVLTANDYLVVRDAAEFRPLFARLGLGVATVVANQPPAERRTAYAQPVCYVTAKELAFDYLRDRLMHGAGRPALLQRVAAFAGGPAEPPLLRGLCFAIVDEADSVLIDEAQTPLVLSRERRDAAAHAYLWQAWALSGRLAEGDDFRRHEGGRQVELTEAGRGTIEQLAEKLQPVWKNRLHREETIVAALTARHALQRDRDYVVTDTQDGARIDIVDAVTGRIAEGRKWSAGLHGLVALKEGLRAEGELETLARITFQRFFRRYHRLGGMSGTLSESRGELRRLYGLAIVPVAPRLPLARRQWPMRCYTSDAARWEAVVARAGALATAGRPVLIGTDSVGDSLQVSARLAAAGIAHAVLNARNDAEEARIVAEGGRPGRVTVSTNMAGRGTDIHVAPEALAAGGLHVLSCQHNPSRRQDRQLFGRAGRQGQPGSSEAWISLESPRFSGDQRSRGSAIISALSRRDGQLRSPAWLTACAYSALQRFDEARQARRRTRLFRDDCELERNLSFCGST